ncbi:MAG: homoserine kinase [Geodermatophilaceae bacterium]
MPKPPRRHSVSADRVSAVDKPDAPACVRVRVPATSANLGPGFDCLGLALSLYDEVEITMRSDDEVMVEIAGLGADSLPRDERHLLLASMRKAALEFGVIVRGVELRVRNAIPQGRGLGSSAATITAGVTAAWMLAPGQAGLDAPRILDVAAGIEGHPDNVAACVYGGLTISWQGGHGAAAVALTVHPDVAPVLFVPEFELSTNTARGLLPTSVPHADAAFNSGRSALLVHALTSAPDLLLDATEDRLHQKYRSTAMPETMTMLEGLRGVGVAAVVSGAGPSVLALSRAGAAHPQGMPLP